MNNHEDPWDNLEKSLLEIEVQLNEEEEEDIKKIIELSGTTPNNLGTEIFATIENAVYNSISQILALSDGDWRPEKGAIVTTPLNFKNKVFACDADKQRFEMFEKRRNERTGDYRRSKIFANEYAKGKSIYKNQIRNESGCYTDEYTGGRLYDQKDAPLIISPSGTHKRDTTQTINIDHIIPVDDIYKSASVAVFGQNDNDGIKKDISKIVNKPQNFAATSEHINKSMGAQNTKEYAVKHPEKGMQYKKINSVTAKAELSKRIEIAKMACQNQGKQFAVGLGQSTIAATGKMIIGETLKISITEIAIEFKNKKIDKENLWNRIKRVFHNIYMRVKRELSQLWKKVVNFATNNAISEIVNLVINFFSSTIKNIFKLLRCMIGSIIQAIKIIIDKTKPLHERIFEALKIISSGLVFAAGTSLDELLAKAISLHLPFLTPFATTISSIISGLVSSILAALILLMFDKYKANMKFTSKLAEQHQLLEKQTNIQIAKVIISEKKAMLESFRTLQLIQKGMDYIAIKHEEIAQADACIAELNKNNHRISMITRENITDINELINQLEFI